jgi:hypothetical protein
MDQSLHSKRSHHAGFARASFDSPCSQRRLFQTGTLQRLVPLCGK